MKIGVIWHSPDLSDRLAVVKRYLGRLSGKKPKLTPIRKQDDLSQTVLKFINRFTLGATRESVIECFTSGCCWWFAHILCERFKGEMVYDEIDGHFGCEIGGRVYDITGDCTDTFRKTYWSVFEQREPNLSVRILKRRRDFEEDV